MDKYMRVSLHHVLADMTGEKDRMYELPFPLESKHLPADMKFERAYLDVLWEFHSYGDPPVPDSVYHNLTMKGVEITKQEYQDWLKENQTTHSVIRTSVAALVRYINDQILLNNWESALQEIARREGTAQERFHKAIELIGDQFITDDASGGMQRNLDRLADTIEEINRRWERRQRGESPGMMMPFYGLRQLVPVLEEGDISVWAGETKMGKTTLGMEIAEVNAWQFRNPILYIHYETSPWKLQLRQIARYGFVPSGLMASGQINSKDPMIKAVIDDVEDFIAFNEANGAPIIHLYCPGWSNAKVGQVIRLFVASMRAQGYSTPGVIIDYLLKMEDVHSDQRITLARNTETVKTWAATQDIHIALLTQTGIGSTNSGMFTFGASETMMKVQVACQIIREESHETIMVDDGQGGIAKDALGRDRYWQQAGRHWSRDFTVRVALANDDQPGDVTVWLEGPFYRFTDISAPRDVR